MIDGLLLLKIIEVLEIVIIYGFGVIVGIITKSLLGDKND